MALFISIQNFFGGHGYDSEKSLSRRNQNKRNAEVSKVVKSVLSIGKKKIGSTILLQ